MRKTTNKTLGGFALLTGIFLSGLSAYAGVIQPAQKQNENYELHHNITVYNRTTGFQVRPDFTIENLYNVNAGPSAQESISSNNYDSNLTPYSATRPDANLTTPLQSGRSPFARLEGNNMDHMPVGSFLDSFKDDPSLRTIYFTSKALTFGYQKKVANIMQLDFDLAKENYRRETHSRDQGFAVEGPLTDQKAVIVEQQTGLLFGFMTEAYRDIILVLAAMIAGLYLSFRYILGRYI